MLATTCDQIVQEWYLAVEKQGKALLLASLQFIWCGRDEHRLLDRAHMTVGIGCLIEVKFGNHMARLCSLLLLGHLEYHPFANVSLVACAKLVQTRKWLVLTVICLAA